MKAADVILEALKREGVDTIFGFPGGVLLSLYDAIYDSDIKHILARHEQGAGHAADGYARASGKVGVCLATSGPGATNLVTPIANAYMDSVPMVAITGQVSRHLIGLDSFQEADVTGITLPIVKHSYLVKDAAILPRIIREAFYIAGTGRPGPVVIDIPVDVTKEEMEYDPKVLPAMDLPGYKPTVKGHPKQVKEAARLIAKAERPMIYAGGGVITAEASHELRELALRGRIPVTTTLIGKGAFPEDHDLSMGMLGMHGTQYANYAMSRADLVIAVGVRFGDRVTGNIAAFAPEAKFIHVDLDPAEISKNVTVDVPIVGDAKKVLTDLLIEVEKLGLSPDSHLPWTEQVEGWKRDHPLVAKVSEDGEIIPEVAVRKIWEVSRGEAVVCTEVGQNQMWAALHYLSRHPRRFISSGGLGTMGFGFPAAIGAQVACPDALVLDIAGDGSFQMTIQELATAVQFCLPVKVCILNNQYLGMVRQWQELFWNKRYSQTCVECQPDFVKVAEAYGAEGYRATRTEELEEVLRTAFASDRPAVIDIRVKREANVFPMIPAGGSVHDMMEREP
ncbi:MAG: biosynthetic-type acetolactate synthase large subunit [Actinobacteria bacterium]|jgi:acetolactate synthase-1/2/3 large subunit|nr:biosynthetic-type acetolactate synthase large subunit [Actinomycetota bacterium]